MARWDVPLFAFLTAQSPETTRVTIALADLATLTDEPIPDAAYARSYWAREGPGTLGPRLRTAGWRVEGMHEGIHATITFERLPPATSA